MAPVEIAFSQLASPTGAIDSRINVDDEVLAGRFRAGNHAQMMTLERY